MKTKVSKVTSDSIEFDNGTTLYSDHDQDCCEHHYLDFSNLKLEDFKGMEFDLEGDFFEKVEDFGIRLIPLNGHPVAVPGYGSNNGYYSSDLALVLDGREGFHREFDITECQEWDY